MALREKQKKLSRERGRNISCGYLPDDDDYYTQLNSPSQIGGKEKPREKQITHSPNGIETVRPQQQQPQRVLTVSNVSKYDGLDELVTRGPPFFIHKTP